jgi:hypothetical protein
LLPWVYKHNESFIVKKSCDIIASRNTPKVKWQKGVKKSTGRERKFSRFLCLPKCGEFLPFMCRRFLMNDMKCKHFFFPPLLTFTY